MPIVAANPELRTTSRYFHPTDPYLTPHDFTKSIYLNLLVSFPLEDVTQFFSGLPMRWKGRELTTYELLEHLWQDKAKVPMMWDYGAGEALDLFLSRRGVSIIEFYRKLLYRNNHSTYMQGKFLLKWFYPVMKAAFNTDARDMMLRLIPHFTENLLPNHLHRRVKREIRGDWTESVFVYITDKSFQEIVYFDSEVHACEQFKASPGIIDMPPFEETGILCDARPLKAVVWEHPVEEINEVAYIDGKRAGRRIDFKEFCRLHDVDLSEFKVPDSRCILMEEDYLCPVRKRVVLHAGCAYDTTVYLQTIRHKTRIDRSAKVLSHIVDDLEDEDIPLARNMKEKHLAALALVQMKVKLRWFPEDESITLNGEHLVKGVPAKILRSLVTSYLNDGRSVFEYREFKRDFEISLGQKISNFEVRFYRLMEKLEEKCPGIAINKVGRGRFELQTNCKIELEE
jgi:hypothetical protein